MKITLKKLLTALLGMTLVLALCSCNQTGNNAETQAVNEELKTRYSDARIINLDGATATIDNTAIEEYDYTWHCDPSTVHEETENAPAEYYTGEKPATTADVYIDHELYYYPQLSEDGFKKVSYDGEQEWAYYYNDGENNDYIFATLPVLGSSIPTDMMHSEEEAAQNKVLHITAPGKYVITGNWSGQVKVNLDGDSEAFDNPDAKVTLILCGADINCSVAPGIVFESVYECDNKWEEAQQHSQEVDLSEAGAKIIIADDMENSVTGTNVFRMLKTKYKDEDSTDAVKTQKKMRKTDGALYSYMSMIITGEEENSGKLTVNAGFEGIDSELHMDVQGGNIEINSQDDGMNVNEDDVSVIKFTGGVTTINAALGAEGDGVDSNGYVYIDGGTINVNGIRVPDCAIDSEDGIYYMSGKIVIDGEEQTYDAGSVFRETGGNGNGTMGGPGNGQQPPDRPDGQAPDGQQPPERPDGQAPDGQQPPGNPDGQAPVGQQPPTNQGGSNGEMTPPGERNIDIQAFKKKVAELPEDATYGDVLKIIEDTTLSSTDSANSSETANT